jgi:hypothetical protein
MKHCRPRSSTSNRNHETCLAEHYARSSAIPGNCSRSVLRDFLDGVPGKLAGGLHAGFIQAGGLE